MSSDSRAHERQGLDAMTREFLEKGGSIQHCPPGASESVVYRRGTFRKRSADRADPRTDEQAGEQSRPDQPDAGGQVTDAPVTDGEEHPAAADDMNSDGQNDAGYDDPDHSHPAHSHDDPDSHDQAVDGKGDDQNNSRLDDQGTA